MNWTRAYLRPSVAASACASVDLPTPGNVLDQQVAAREQAGERELQRLGLADDDAVELREHGGEPLHDGDVGLAKRSGRSWWRGCTGKSGGHCSCRRRLVTTDGHRLHSMSGGLCAGCRSRGSPGAFAHCHAKQSPVPTAFITHPSFLLHDMGPYHPECPDRLRAIGDRLIAAGLDGYLKHYEAPAATHEQLARVHGAGLPRGSRSGKPARGARIISIPTPRCARIR